ncbi:hypothetical protein, conserved [Eimeria brunetti]|uniref:Protein SDA1 n=1 Tax=Eimeria brunetti TaxID=51314 RepID=U6LQY9_9EIME|nr:hypothetical protein, conserved [Eimeria brunetti]
MANLNEEQEESVVSLALLQVTPPPRNKIKRDPGAYYEEFKLQMANYEGLVAALKEQPYRPTKKIQSLASFLAHLSCEELLQQALSLLSLRDKFVRQRLMAFVVKDVAKVFAATTSNQVYRHLSSKGQVPTSCLSSKLVNAVAALTLAPDPRLALSAALFLLGEIQAAAVQASHAIQADEGEGEEAVAAAAAAELQQQSALHSKKTLAAKRKLKKQKQRIQKRLVRKQQRIEAQQNQLGSTTSAAILDLIYDAHALSEKLFARVRQQRESFSTRVVFLNVLSRLISHHRVLLFSFYSYLERYLKPSQRLNPSLLAVAANSIHPNVPHPELLSLLKTIADNFVTEAAGDDAITLGLNAITEICSRNPHCMPPELLQQLLLFVRHKSSKSVSAAARGLLNLYREVSPQLLPKALLGKEAAIQLQRQGVSPSPFAASSNSTLQLLPQLEALKKQSKQQLQQLLGGAAEEETEGEETAGEETAGEETEGEETEGDSSEDEAEETDGEETDGEETDGEETDGEETDGEEGDSEEGDSEEEKEKETAGEKDGPEKQQEETAAAANETAAAAAAAAAAKAEPGAAPAADSEPAAAAATATAAAAAAAAATEPCGGERLLTDEDFAALRLLRAKQLVQQEEFVSERDLEGLAGRKKRRAKERGREREERLQQKRQRSSRWPQKETDTAAASKPQRVKDRNKPLLMIQQV